MKESTYKKELKKEKRFNDYFDSNAVNKTVGFFNYRSILHDERKVLYH